jgi:hypothetical protein
MDPIGVSWLANKNPQNRPNLCFCSSPPAIDPNAPRGAGLEADRALPTATAYLHFSRILQIYLVELRKRGVGTRLAFTIAGDNPWKVHTRVCSSKKQ